MRGPETNADRVLNWVLPTMVGTGLLALSITLLSTPADSGKSMQAQDKGRQVAQDKDASPVAEQVVRVIEPESQWQIEHDGTLRVGNPDRGGEFKLADVYYLKNKLAGRSWYVIVRGDDMEFIELDR